MGPWDWARIDQDSAERVTEALAAHDRRPTVLDRRIAFEKAHPDIKITLAGNVWQVQVPGDALPMAYVHASRMMDDLEARYPA